MLSFIFLRGSTRDWLSKPSLFMAYSFHSLRLSASNLPLFYSMCFR
jgi:hypothetical protein